MTSRLLRIVALIGILIVAWGIATWHSQKHEGANKTMETWSTILAKAAVEANQTGKIILADFTGSDWCPWCQKLKSEVFETAQFQEWAAAHVVLMEVDFPKRTSQDDATKKQNMLLANRYKVEGFPTVVFLKPDGTEIGRTGYVDGGPKAWIDSAEAAMGGGQSAH